MKAINVPMSRVLIAAIAATPPTLASLGALVLTLRATDKVEAVAARVEEVHTNTNSMKDAMVASALKEGRVEGVKAEKARAKSSK